VITSLGANLRDSLLVPLRACRNHASLLVMLIRRDVVSRTSGTLLGRLWPLLQPALQVLGFWFMFDVVWSSRAGGDANFLEYLLVGILPWLLLTEVLTRSAGLFREFSALYRRTPFPVELLPILVMVIPGIVYLVVFCGVALTFYGPGGALHALLVVPLLLLWLLPLAFLFSVLGVFLRDFAQALPFVLILVKYATPILYRPEY
jgi:lipopolysaccharide transport system permease protein